MIIDSDLDKVVVNAEIVTPNEGDSLETTTKIQIKGSDMKVWVDENEKHRTNQIYKDGCCGIFGFAQYIAPEGQPASWIYTLTGGVCEPKEHPRE